MANMTFDELAALEEASGVSVGSTTGILAVTPISETGVEVVFEGVKSGLAKEYVVLKKKLKETKMPSSLVRIETGVLDNDYLLKVMGDVREKVYEGTGALHLGGDRSKRSKKKGRGPK